MTQPLPQQKVSEQVFTLREKKRDDRVQIKNIFTSFSKSSLNVIKEACNFAKHMGKTGVGPWHLLKVLTTKKELISQIDVNSLKTITDKTDKTLLEDKTSGYSGILFFTPEIKKILIAAYFISKQKFSESVGVSDLILALSVYPEMQDIFSSLSLPDNSSNFYIPKSIAEFSTDLTTTAKLEENVYKNRETELENIIRILARESKHNVILLGEEGVGKSTLGMGLAGFLADKKFPNFTDIHVISLNIGSLFSISSDF